MILLSNSLYAQFGKPAESSLEKGSAIEKIIANTRVGDQTMEICSFDITVNDAKVLKNITAEDFNLTGNGYTGYCDPQTFKPAEEYKNDGIKITKQGKKLHIEAKPFSINGVRGANWQTTPWEMHCTNPALQFSLKHVDEKTTSVLDDCIHGEFTYAGLTREYMLYLPKDKNGKTIKNVPLLVWQIGGGEYDRDMMTVATANRCLTSLPEAGQVCATLVFAIANPNYYYSASLDPERIKLIDRNNALQMAFIDTLIEDGTIDGSRVFCSGASSGGGCTMRFMMQFPDRFKAAIPCCSMDPIVPIHQVKDLDQNQLREDLYKAFQGKVYKWNGTDMVLSDINTKAFVNLPLFFVHAINDNTCKVISSQAYYDVRKRLGAKNDELLIYRDIDMNEYGVGGPIFAHFSWVRLLNDYFPGSAMDWLVKKF